MRPTPKRFAVTAAFTLLCPLQIVFISGAKVDGLGLILLLLLAAGIAYAVWPTVERAAAENGSTLRPSGDRFAGSVASAVLLGVPFNLVVGLFQTDPDRPSQALATPFFFGVIAYLAWPNIRREMRNQRGQ